MIICLAANLLNEVISIKVANKKLNNETNDTINNTNVTLVYPIIEENRHILGIEGNFEKVQYVKEISEAGKRAIELAESGE
jgi:hypothetical protein